MDSLKFKRSLTVCTNINTFAFLFLNTAMSYLKLRRRLKSSYFRKRWTCRYTYLVLGTHGSHFNTNTHESWIKYTECDTRKCYTLELTTYLYIWYTRGNNCGAVSDFLSTRLYLFWRRRGRDFMVVGFTTTYAISANHH